MQYIGAFSRILYIYFLCFVPSYEVKLIFLPRVWLTFTESGSKIGFGKIQWFLRFIYCTNTLVSTYFYNKKRQMLSTISERCKVGQYFLTNFLNFSATHHSRWKESLFVTDIFLLSCVHFVILFPTCKKVCVRCYTCLWAYFYFYKWQNPFYDRVTF